MPAAHICLAAGLFDPAVNYPVGTPPAWISGGDFDGDTYPGFLYKYFTDWFSFSDTC